MSYGSADIGVVVGQIGILGDSQDREARKRRRDDVTRHPRPDEKPRPDAQWDEVRAVWQAWDADTGAWVDLTDDDPAADDDPVT